MCIRDRLEGNVHITACKVPSVCDGRGLQSASKLDNTLYPKRQVLRFHRHNVIQKRKRQPFPHPPPLDNVVTLFKPPEGNNKRPNFVSGGWWGGAGGRGRLLTVLLPEIYPLSAGRGTGVSCSPASIKPYRMVLSVKS